MRNMVPARSLARRSRDLMLIAILLLVIGILALIASSFMNSIPIVAEGTENRDFYEFAITAFAWMGGLIIALSLLMLLRAFTWKRDNPIAAQIGDVLEQELNLDDRYAYIRNVSRFAIGYVDAVLVGPPGVLVMRISNKGGVFFNQGSKWMKQRDKDNWQPLNWSPSEEVATDVKKVREFLQTRGLPEIPVFAVVVFTEDQPATRVTTENPTVPVMQPFEMAYSLESSYFAQRDRLEQLKVNEVIKALF